MKITINTLAKNIILELINKTKTINKRNIGRPAKCTNEQYIDYIFNVLKTGCGWDYVNGIVSGDMIRKKFKEWVNRDIFKCAWNIILHIYSTFKLDFEDLFIDASHIKNILGNEKTGIPPSI